MSKIYCIHKNKPHHGVGLCQSCYNKYGARISDELMEQELKEIREKQKTYRDPNYPEMKLEDHAQSIKDWKQIPRLLTV